MHLNFTFNAPEMASTGCKEKEKVDQCIFSTAVHEFGHALGFVHEQDSPRIPEWCKNKLNPPDIQKPAEVLKAKMLTAWDKFSVMDYCQDIYRRRVQLSDCDIAAYWNMYGVPLKPAYQTSCPIEIQE